MNASKLAEKYSLSRKINSVNRDSKRKQLIVTIDVAKRLEAEWIRSETYYYFSEDPATCSEVNILIEAAMQAATFEFLGLEPEEKADTEVEAKPAKPSKKKASKKAAAKAKKEEAPEVVEPEEDDLADLGGLEEESEPNILFDKSKLDHAAALSANIREAFGEDWKKDAAKKTCVRKTIAKLDNKIEVMDSKLAILDSFNAFCKEELK